MKKIILAVVMGSLILCAGCSNSSESEVSSAADRVVNNSGDKGAESASADEKTDDKSAESILESADASSQVSLAGMLPDASAIFKEATFNVVSDGETMYCFMVDGFNDGEYEKYVEACKETFPDVKFDIYTDSNNRFEAKTEDGKYYVSVQLIFDQNAFTVTCGVSRT